MIETRTVFVLGAGASCPYEFPTARRLRTQILVGLSGWYGVFHDQEAKRVQNGYPEMPVLLEFLDKFGRSNTESIDLFLSRWPKFETIGKIAILLGILQKERESYFGDKVKQADRDWYFYLYNRLTRELTGRDGYEDFGGNRIAFITFNYDRSLEHFLFESLLHSFEDADVQKVRTQVDGIPIIHVYGKLAPLPWQEDDTSKVLGYGDQKSVSSINALSMIRNLYVVHEERANPDWERARKEIREAERIFFLGFGYAKENLEALGLPDVLKANHYIYGTALDYKEREIKDIESFFTQGLGEKGRQGFAETQVKIRNCDCVHLLREFS